MFFKNLKQIILLLTVLVISSGLTGCNYGKTVNGTEEFIVLETAVSDELVNYMPDAPEISDELKLQVKYSYAASYQVFYKNRFINLIDMETGKNLEADHFEFRGNKLYLTGPFQDKTLALRITNRGDMLKIVPKDPDSPPDTDTLAGKNYFMIIGKTGTPAAGTVVKTPDLDLEEIMASQVLAKTYESEGTNYSLISNYISFKTDASDNPVKINGAQIFNGIARKKYDEKIKDLSKLSSANARKMLFQDYFTISVESASIDDDVLKETINQLNNEPILNNISPLTVDVDDVDTQLITVLGERFRNKESIKITINDTDLTPQTASDTQFTFLLGDDFDTVASYDIKITITQADNDTTYSAVYKDKMNLIDE